MLRCVTWYGPPDHTNVATDLPTNTHRNAHVTIHPTSYVTVYLSPAHCVLNADRNTYLTA